MPGGHQRDVREDRLERRDREEKRVAQWEWGGQNGTGFGEIIGHTQQNSWLARSVRTEDHALGILREHRWRPSNNRASPSLQRLWVTRSLSWVCSSHETLACGITPAAAPSTVSQLPKERSLTDIPAKHDPIYPNLIPPSNAPFPNNSTSRDP